MNYEELATLGADIVAIGGELKKLKTARDELNLQIDELTTRLQPLVARHAAIIAEISGVPVEAKRSVAADHPTVFPRPGSHPDMTNRPGPDMKEVHAKVLAFLQTAEGGISAEDIGNALRIDPILVRQVIAAMMRSAQGTFERPE